MGQALEVLHMTVYFAPEPRDAFRRSGLRAIPDAWGSPPPPSRLPAGRGWLEGDGLLSEAGRVPFPNPVGLPHPRPDRAAPGETECGPPGGCWPG